jgi:leucyl aminopeptidase
MTVPEFSVSTQPPVESNADVLVLAALATDGAPLLRADPAFEGLAEQLAMLGVTGARDEVVRIPASIGAARSIAIVGLG